MQGAVEDQIYPQIATGFLDSNAYLRELTLKSMLLLAPKLTQRTLNQSLLKSLAKLQVGCAHFRIINSCMRLRQCQLSPSAMIPCLELCLLMDVANTCVP